MQSSCTCLTDVTLTVLSFYEIYCPSSGPGRMPKYVYTAHMASIYMRMSTTTSSLASKFASPPSPQSILWLASPSSHLARFFSTPRQDGRRPTLTSPPNDTLLTTLPIILLNTQQPLRNRLRPNASLAELLQPPNLTHDTPRPTRHARRPVHPQRSLRHHTRRSLAVMALHLLPNNNISSAADKIIKWRVG